MHGDGACQACDDGAERMDLARVCFDGAAVERLAMGAGVIPLSHHPATGEVHLLLGRERWLSTWKGSCRWSGFEGARKEAETVVAAAARECDEETLGVLGPLRARLDAGDYWVRVVLSVAHDRRPAPERYHATYVVPVPWDARVGERFAALRAAIEHVDRLAQELAHTRPAVLGADEGWAVGPIAEDADGGVRVLRPRDGAPGVLPPAWTVDAGGAALRTAAPAGSVAARELSAWARVRARLERALPAHPCVRATRDARWGHVQAVHVARDHLEKDQMRWWSAADLRRVLAQRGHDGPERFRPYFMPVLQAVLEELAAETPPPRARVPPGLGVPATPPAPPPPTAPARG
jgi:hypothetical protein